MPGSVMTQRVAILGSGGYIGSTLVRELRRQGIDTLATSRTSQREALRINVLDEGIGAKFKALGVTTVVDCSGSVPATTQSNRNSTHVDGALNLTAQLRGSGIRLIHIATSLPLGTSDGRTQIYLHDKRMSESIVREWLESSQGNGAILKLDSVYGYDLPQGRFLSDCAAAARAARSFPVRQPNASRGFTHERDLVDALAWLLDQDVVYRNLVCVKPLSFLTMREAAAKIFRQVPEIDRLRKICIGAGENPDERIDFDAQGTVFRAQTSFDVGIVDALSKGLGAHNSC